MKKYILIALTLAYSAMLFVSCDDSILDRPDQTKFTDDKFWRSESDLRLYSNEFYPQYFTGYNSSFSTPWAMLRGYAFSDNVVTSGKQSSFPSSLPNDLGSTSLQGADWRTQWQGQMWNFAWVRKCNIMLDRLENVSKSTITDEAYKHWTAVARLFRAWEYHRLVITFGDVPYYDAPVSDADPDDLFKARTPRDEVMGHVYDDLQYALANVRENDGNLSVNRDIVAAVASRILLFEGTWQKYHNDNTTLAKKYLDACVSASEIVMNSGKYSCTMPFRTLFGSDNLAGHPGVIMYRHYVDGEVTHCIASYSNGEEGNSAAGNLSLIKAFICNDGKTYQNSTVADADKFDVPTLAKTRDSRFEATFFNFPHIKSSSLLCQDKFISREGANYVREDNLANLPSKYRSNTNTNDAPCLRYAEVLLNWIEAKAELATMGGAAVTQSDLDKSINVIRNRPLDDEAIATGVTKTAPLMLSLLPNDPARDSDVPALIWEIRRERRMEFIYESSRLHDIRRWKKIQYMNCTTHPDNLFGPWVDFPNELPSFLTSGKVGLLKVRHADGTIVTYDGTNGDQMVGFYQTEKAADRNVFGDEVYLSPVGKNQITDYENKGYVLTQTPLWDNFK